MRKSQLKRYVAQDAMVVARCIGCNDRREIAPGEITHGEHPICTKCGMPMIAVSASKIGMRKP